MHNSTEDKILKLLGDGVKPEIVAASVGVSVSRVSQLLSDEQFAAQVAELRFSALNKHNERDRGYDALEDELIEKLRDCLPLMHRPMEVLKAIQVINAAKRRGSSAPDSIVEKQTVINLVLPTVLINKFQVNNQGQVVKVGDQDLITIQSGALETLVKDKPKQVTYAGGEERTG